MKTSSAPFNLGQVFGEAVALHRAGQLRQAERIYARVVKVAPDHFDALNLLGAVKIQQGQFGEAQRLFGAAIKINPRIPAAWCNLGQAQYALKRPADALQSFDKARALAPEDVDILYQHANALLALDRPREALAELEVVLARKPQHFEARLNSGLAQAKLENPECALADFDSALALVPQHPVAHFNRGVVLIKLGRYAEAVAANERAIAAAPDYVAAWLNRGMALAQLRCFEEAIASYGEVLARRKDNADAHFNRALALLTIGDYRRGFEDYEWRWRRTGVPAPKNRGRRLWLGEFPLAGKTILLHAEQGLGDTIQFARYAPLVAAQGAKVVLEVQPELKSLLSRLDGVTAVVARGEAPPPFDVHCPLGSLPLARKTELPVVPAQLAATAQLTHLGGELADLNDTAGVLAMCDLLITVDTAPAHLAGAMGRPVWVLVPFAPDWRWMLDGEITPWYPSARVFRQSALADWNAVIARAAAALQSRTL